MRRHSILISAIFLVASVTLPHVVLAGEYVVRLTQEQTETLYRVLRKVPLPREETESLYDAFFSQVQKQDEQIRRDARDAVLREESSRIIRDREEPKKP